MKYYEIHTMSHNGRPGRLTLINSPPDEAGWAPAARFDTYMDALDFGVEWNELNNFDKRIYTYEIVEKGPMAVDDTLQVVKSTAPGPRSVPSPVQALLDGDPVPFLENRIDFLLSALEDLVGAAADTLDGGCTAELEYQIGLATDIVNGEV